MINGQMIDNGSQNQNSFPEILLFTSPTSPYRMLEKYLLETIIERKLPIKVTKIDILRKPEVAEEHDIIACPTLIFRNFMKVHGNCEREELEELLTTYCSLATSKYQNQ